VSWRLARSLQTLQRELDQRFPGRLKPDWTIGDPAHRSRASDHNPRRGDGAVCAIDVRGATTAQALWNHLLLTRDDRVKYVIFNGKIVHSTNQPWVIRQYRGANPHRDHLHLSVGRGPDGSSTGPVDDRTPWGLLSTPTPPPAPPDTQEATVIFQQDYGTNPWRMVFVPDGTVYALPAGKSTAPATLVNEARWDALVARYDKSKQLVRLA
jgi:hypothetical protein